MNKNDFQRKVEIGEGYIFSDGTLNLTHLLSNAYDFLVQYELNENLQKQILEVFEIDFDFKENYHSLFITQYYSKARIKDDKKDDANYLWNEDIYNLFNEISPDGYYFGSNYGDGALIGWFKIEEEF